MDGPRLDSHLRSVRFVFEEIDLGLRFVRSARRLTDRSLRATVLKFALHAYETARYCSETAPLTPDERERARAGLDSLFRQIERYSRMID